MELKEFEEKINNITEQFKSLLDSNTDIGCSIGGNIGNIDSNINSTGNGVVFKLGTDDVKIGGIGYKTTYDTISDEMPKHAIKFDSVEQMDLNTRLESLYNENHSYSAITAEKPNIAFSDANIGRINSFGVTETYYGKKETNYTNDKEGYEMAGYNGEEGKDNVFYSFATIPEERALVEKRDWKEVLFMDIPWDTKIDIWGGIKKLCTAQVKITFN